MIIISITNNNIIIGQLSAFNPFIIVSNSNNPNHLKVITLVALSVIWMTPPDPGPRVTGEKIRFET